MEQGLILVIGASRGIGKAVVLNLAAAYPTHQLIAVSRNITTQQSEFTSHSPNINCFDADMSCDSGIFSLIGRITSQIKFLIYCSGEMGPLYTENPSPEDFDRIVSINTKAPYFLTQQLSSKFQEHAKIIYITTGVAKFYGCPTPLYSISKAALNMV